MVTCPRTAASHQVWAPCSTFFVLADTVDLVQPEHSKFYLMRRDSGTANVLQFDVNTRKIELMESHR